MSQELITLLVGASPIAEVRGAIPLALGAFHFGALKAYVLGVGGNLIPIIPGFLFLRYAASWCIQHVYILNRFFTWLFERTRSRHGEKFETWSMLVLFLFVAIPLPLTGVYSGIVVAFLFNLPFWRSIFAISLGAATAGLIVLAATLGFIFVF